MNPEGALSRMRVVVALWYVGEASAADIVRAACDLLVADLDGPAVCMLAAVSIRHAEEDVPALLESALGDLGLTYHQRGTVRADIAGLKVMASRALSGDLAPRWLCSWAHATFGHGVLQLAESLVGLDDEYDVIEYTDATTEGLDAEVMAEARRIVTNGSAAA